MGPKLNSRDRKKLKLKHKINRISQKNNNAGNHYGNNNKSGTSNGYIAFASTVTGFTLPKYSKCVSSEENGRFNSAFCQEKCVAGDDRYLGNGCIIVPEQATNTFRSVGEGKTCQSTKKHIPHSFCEQQCQSTDLYVGVICEIVDEISDDLNTLN